MNEKCVQSHTHASRVEYKNHMQKTRTKRVQKISININFKKLHLKHFWIKKYIKCLKALSFYKNKIKT